MMIVPYIILYIHMYVVGSIRKPLRQQPTEVLKTLLTSRRAGWQLSLLITPKKATTSPMMRAYPPPTTTKEGFLNHAWRGKSPMMTAKIRKGFWIQWLKIASIKQVIVIDVIEMLNWDTLESTTLLKWPVFWICSCNPILTPLTSGITCTVICIYISFLWQENLR